MATVTLGNIKFNWKGAWNSATSYVVDDVVSLSGSSYVCIQAGTNQNPSTATAYWEQMSSAGTNGTDLTTTLTTQGDIVYRDGSGLARLGAGTSGYFLKTQGTGANPIWAESSGGVIQTVTTSNAFHTSNSTSWTSTGYDVTITPTSASNKIHVHCNLSHAGTQGNASLFKIQRSIGGASYADVDLPSARGSRIPAHAGTEHNQSNGASFVTLRIVDSTHNTTSAITYRLFKRQESNASATVIGNPHNGDADAGSGSAQTATINTNMIAEERT